MKIKYCNQLPAWPIEGALHILPFLKNIAGKYMYVGQSPVFILSRIETGSG